MRNLISFITIFMMGFNLLSAQDISLPTPQKSGGLPLMDALNHRHSSREFSDKMLSQQQLADLLWAANGVNRPDGKRTAPSARNLQEIDIYVYLSTGVYFYDAIENKLVLKASEDHREDAAMQSFATTAPVLLVFVANYDKMEGMDEDARLMYGATDCGYVSQNVYLFCAADELNTVVLGSIYRDKIQELLQFNGKAILAQPVGLSK